MKKLLSILLCLVMFAALLPVAAAEEEEVTEITEGDYSESGGYTDMPSDHLREEYNDESADVFISVDEKDELDSYTVGENETIDSAFEFEETIKGKITSASGSDYTNSPALAAKLDQIFAGHINMYKLSNGNYVEVIASLGSKAVPPNEERYIRKDNKTITYGQSCWAYANAVYWTLYGDYFIQSNHNVYGGTSNSELCVKSPGEKVTYDNLKKWGVRQGVGAYVDVLSSSHHVFIILNYDKDYITILHGNGDGSGSVYILKCTWKDFSEGSGNSCLQRNVYEIFQPKQSYVDANYPECPGGADHDKNGQNQYWTKGQCSICGAWLPNKNDNYSYTPGTYAVKSGKTAYLREGHPYQIATPYVTLSAGSTVKVDGCVLNGFGNQWYHCVYNSKEYWCVAGNLELKTAAASDLKIDMPSANIPSGNLTQGNTFPLKGTISSTYYNITNVACHIYNSSGNDAITAYSATPNARSYDIKTGGMDSKMTFGKLSVGSYTFVVSAKDASGKTAELRSSFKIVSSTSTTVTVTFNANGGSVSPSSATVTVGSAYGTLPTPTRTGYRFTGWYTAASGGTQVTASTTVTNTSSHTLYAHWTPYTYTVTLNANGGSVSPTSITVTYDSTYSGLPTPTRTGYDFNGWFTASSGGSQVTTSTKVTTASNHTLYAQWTARQYNVQIEFRVDGIWTQDITEVGSFDLYINGQKWQEDRATSWEYPLSYGSVWEITDIKTKSGKAFTGCTQGSIAGTVTGYQYIELAFNTQTVTVTFDRNYEGASTITQTYTYGEPYGSLPHPMRGGYRLIGWFTEPDGGTQITEETIVVNASDHKLYAHWSKQRIKLLIRGEVDNELAVDIVGYGTYDVYINGEKVADDQTSFNRNYTWDESSTYEIRNIRVKNGVSYNGIVEGTRTDTLRYNRSIKLGFTTVQPEEWLEVNNPEEYSDGDRTYLFFSEPVTWYEAKTISEYLGGHLLRIDDSAENTYINNATDQAECWLGAMDETYGEEIYRNFVWIDDGTELSYKNWAAGQPDNDADNDEGSSNFVYMTPIGKWATAPGCTKHGFVCEIDQTAIPFNGTIEWNASDVQFKGTTPYVVYNGAAFTPRFTVKDKNGNVVSPSNYTYEYRENRKAGTGYVIVTFTGGYSGTARAWFKIYLPPTTGTTVENVKDGIKISWEPVEGAAGYVVYRRAWSSTTNGWTTFER